MQLADSPLIGRASFWSSISFATLLALGAGTPSWANETTDRTALPHNVVYVQTNTPGAGKNAVLAYRRDGNGRLTPLAGSPFPSGGKGFFDSSFKLGPFDSDQNVVVDQSRRLLFSVNSGSNTIAVFKIAASGGLTAIKGSPFPSGGINPVGVGIKGDFLVVANKDADPAQPDTRDRPGYNTFRIGHEGRLIPVPGSAVRFAEGTSPTQPLTTDTGRFVFSSEFPAAGVFDVLRLTATGDLRLLGTPAVPPLDPAATPPGPAPLGLWAHPKRPLLYAGLPAAGMLGVFRWNDAGTLKPLRTVSTVGAAPCWVRVNRAGTRIYVSNTGTASIAVFDSSDPAKPRLIQNLALNAEGSIFQITLDEQEQYLYVVGQRSTAAQPAAANSLHVLRVLGHGRLQEVASSPLQLPVPFNSRPQGVAAL